MRPLDVPHKFKAMYERGQKGSRKAAIRCHCLMCMGWDERAVGECGFVDCPLFNLRGSEPQSPPAPPVKQGGQPT